MLMACVRLVGAISPWELNHSRLRCSDADISGLRNELAKIGEP